MKSSGSLPLRVSGVGTVPATARFFMSRHGRVSEAVSLRWEQVDLKAGLPHVQRLKHGVPSTHPLRGPELRALRQLRRDWPEGAYLLYPSAAVR